MPEYSNQGEGPWLVNQRTDEALAERVELAVTRADRRKGLLGRDAFEASSALIIAPCFSIHTMFMAASTSARLRSVMLRTMLSTLSLSQRTTHASKKRCA